MTVAEQIGRNLRAVRRRADLSQDDLMGLSGLHRTEISLLERGIRSPRIETCIRIVQSTGGDLADLVAGVRWHGPLSFREKGWFTIAGSSEPVEVRASRSGERS